MRALVTGAAGFVGSHLCEHLLDERDDVVGLDCFTPYYARSIKEKNLSAVMGRDGFRFVEADVSVDDLDGLLEGTEAVYHLAAQPGVRASWGRDFETYVRHNVLATQRLLEACTGRALKKVLYASSSSVYGDAESYPTSETAPPRPISPYGVTKLTAEHLCEAYRKAASIPTASLRLFTVYGPRQRPDMAFARLVEAARSGTPFEVYGDGEQTRDFTFVTDVVRAFRGCAISDWCGIANIGGGSRVSLNEVIDIVRSHVGPVEVMRRPAQRGDVRDTAADISVARDAFGYKPAVSVNEGLAAMIVPEAPSISEERSAT